MAPFFRLYENLIRRQRFAGWLFDRRGAFRSESWRSICKGSNEAWQAFCQGRFYPQSFRRGGYFHRPEKQAKSAQPPPNGGE